MAEIKVPKLSKDIINNSLIWAVCEGELERTRELIEFYGLCYCEEWLGGYVLLCYAITNKRTAVVELLLSRGSIFNRTSNEYNKGTKYDTPLHLAVKCGVLDIVKMILNEGGLINDQNHFGETPLHCAVKDKEIDLVILLMEHGANVCAKDSSGLTPLHHAVGRGRLQIIELLIHHGSDIKCVCGFNQITLLHYAVQNNHNKEVVSLILLNGAEVKSTCREDVSPLHIAIMAGKLDVVRHLLLYSTDKHFVYRCKEYSMLHYVLEKNNTEIVTLLLNNGLDVNAQSKDGSTALFAATKKGFARVVEVLLEYNADPKLGDEDNITPLHLSAERGYEDISKMLLFKGANVNAEQKDGSTALHMAIHKSHKNIVKLLLENGAKTGFKNQNGFTTLHLAAQKGNEDIVKMILKSGAEIDSKDKHGRTALHLASHDGHYRVAEILLEYGSDINVLCDNGFTALNYAKKQWKNLDVYFDNDVNSSFTVIALECHVIKLRTANLYLSTNLLPLIYEHYLPNFQFMCELEMAKIKSVKFRNTNSSYYDILAKGTNKLAILMANENVVQVLQSENYKIKYPLYRYMIENNFNKGIKRKELLDQCDEIFQFLFPMLPDNCKASIYNYLENKDLRILLEASTPLGINYP